MKSAPFCADRTKNTRGSPILDRAENGTCAHLRNENGLARPDVDDLMVPGRRVADVDMESRSNGLRPVASSLGEKVAGRKEPSPARARDKVDGGWLRRVPTLAGGDARAVVAGGPDKNLGKRTGPGREGAHQPKPPRGGAPPPPRWGRQAGRANTERDVGVARR